jgi:hypothetical protein
MLLLRRYLVASVLFIILTIYYLHSVWSLDGFSSGRTFQGRLLGVIGFLLIVASLFSRAEHGQAIDKHLVRAPWHLLLGSLSICVILAHASCRFGNLIAVFGFVFLIGVVLSGVLIIMIDRHIARPAHLRQRCTSVHNVLKAGLMAFVLVHILSILYY